MNIRRMIKLFPKSEVNGDMPRLPAPRQRLPKSKGYPPEFRCEEREREAAEFYEKQGYTVLNVKQKRLSRPDSRQEQEYSIPGGSEGPQTRFTWIPKGDA